MRGNHGTLRALPGEAKLPAMDGVRMGRKKTGKILTFLPEYFGVGSESTRNNPQNTLEKVETSHWVTRNAKRGNIE